MREKDERGRESEKGEYKRDNETKVGKGKGFRVKWIENGEYEQLSQCS